MVMVIGPTPPGTGVIKLAFGSTSANSTSPFVAYFLYLIAKFLIQDFRKYFTSESGAYGISLCLCLVYAYCTAGMLRRPNASVYMSVLLAAVYYLTQMRSEQPDALPDGEEKTA